ncbi:substrate-binding domain-containing protein [[Clostridium] polysaccharolyticum]|uniref:Tungstate transport system substrate-binding protein n=1 Tax=[Clostridium] polysaccharolyticum TaxID=29364 RepID=A0A1I0ED76_9FIRM|nr:substrate-binding domain-containing protein [[Clostridium] polysaccharolyticum]SET43163.1 tungstate transport system substrate-binding protein [[Clostridium] polysaccharolyticum]
MKNWMKKMSFWKSALIVMLVAVLSGTMLIGCGAKKEEAKKNTKIRLSTTTSVNDSGLLPFLQGDFEKDTGYTLEITSAGTGAAIEKGKTGDADCLLVHAKSAEEEFIEEGYGVERVVLMYNYFVIVGPENDPAGIKGVSSASEAFQKIKDSGCSFVSRGDDSGTNKAELKIWDSLGIDPDGQDWYISTGQGMGASINVASEKQAYIFTDKASYLSHSLKDSLALLLEESDDLKNTYSMIAVNKEKWPDTNTEGASEFIKWMKSDKAKDLITSYGKEEYGQPLFYIDQ